MTYTDTIRDSHPVLVRSVIARFNEWVKSCEGFLASTARKEMMASNFNGNALFDELSDDIMRGIVDEAPEMGDPECTVMYPTIFLMDEEKVVPDGRIKGHSPSGPAVVAIVDGNLAFAARIQLGSALVPIGGLIDRVNVRSAYPVKMGRIMPAHGVQFVTVDDGESIVVTFLWPSDFIASDWRSFQKSLIQPFR